jgi:hypothetical protein
MVSNGKGCSSYLALILVVRVVSSSFTGTSFFAHQICVSLLFFPIWGMPHSHSRTEIPVWYRTENVKTQQQQQQQQLNLLSQASWGRLEMKPTRNKGRRSAKHKNTKEQRKIKDHVSGTLIASLQALLSITNSLGMSHSLRSPLTDSS